MWFLSSFCSGSSSSNRPLLDWESRPCLATGARCASDQSTSPYSSVQRDLTTAPVSCSLYAEVLPSLICLAPPVSSYPTNIPLAYLPYQPKGPLLPRPDPPRPDAAQPSPQGPTQPDWGTPTRPSPRPTSTHSPIHPPPRHLSNHRLIEPCREGSRITNGNTPRGRLSAVRFYAARRLPTADC